MPFSDDFIFNTEATVHYIDGNDFSENIYFAQLMLRTNRRLPYVKGQVECESAIGTHRNCELVIANLGNNEGAFSLI